jgi:hypothetical protein
MAYDIYGNNLRRGFCEVHPHVNEEYPCSLCYAEEDNRRCQKSQYEMMHDEMQKEYYSQMESEMRTEFFIECYSGS